MNLKKGLLILGAFVTISAFAKTEEWRIDEDHSSVRFSIRHLVSTVYGSLGGAMGHITLDDSKPTAMKAEASFDINTINTGNEKRDGHLKSPDFFNASAFPKIEFKSKSVSKSGSGFDMKGDLSMHGVTKEVTVHLDAPTEAAKGMMNDWRRGLNGKITVKRGDFGISWNKTLDAGHVMIGDEVKGEIALELVRTEKK